MDKEDVFGSKISVTCGRIQDVRDGSPHLQISRSRQSSNGGGSSRDSSPVLAELNHILQRQRSQSETGLSQDSLDICPPPPDVIRQGPSSQSLSSYFASLEIKEPANKGPVEQKSATIVVKEHQDNRSWNSSPFNESVKKKVNQKNIGRVSPFLMADTSVRPNMASPHCQNSKHLLFPVDPHPFRIPVSRFSPIAQAAQAVSSSPAPLYTWNPATLLNRDKFHQPSVRSISPVPSADTFAAPHIPVELVVTNLDQNIEANEMKKILLSAFREHVMVLHISILLQPDGTLKAIVKVPSAQDAQLAISQIQRRKIGFKRILISNTSNDRAPPLSVLKYEVATLLSDVPNNKIPLFKFRELFENRYHHSIASCDLYKLKDVVHISDENSGRMVCFHPGYRPTPSPVNSDEAEMDGMESSYCQHHARIPNTQGWAEAGTIYPLPNIHISLKSLSPKVHTLLDTHQGSLPLYSFSACYEAEFGELPTDSSNPSPQSSIGVPLEHLISCIPGVQITTSLLGVKRVQWLQNKDLQTPDERNISPSLMGQVSLFSREVVDLLKNQPHCSIPLHKFIPLYHHHFGRQCRVSDYGYTKLIDLLQAIPHVVQILGQGQNRSLTLSHRAQMKRFASDLLRMLKSQPNKQLSLVDLPAAYERVLGKQLDINHYGICVLEDIVGELSDSSVVVTHINGETCVAIPKREQTSEEMERTREFSQEVIEILSHTPTCSMLFNKFVPAYHHHYGRQCKVADFGFSKLIELFEAVPYVLEISGSGEDKIVSLSTKEKLQVLGQRIVALIFSAGGSKQFLPMDDVEDAYLKLNGYPLQLKDFSLSSFQEMVEALQNYVKVQEVKMVKGLTVVDQTALQRTKTQLLCLLMECPSGQVPLTNLRQLYLSRYKITLDPGLLSQSLKHYVKVEKDAIALTPVQLLLRNILQLLQENSNQLPLNSVEGAFLNRFGMPCQPALYKFQSLAALVASAPEIFTVKGKKKKVLHVNPNNNDIPQISSHHHCTKPSTDHGPGNQYPREKHDLELLMRASPLDLMSQPIPSSVPSPEIEPELQPVQHNDLMGFESPMPVSNDIITGPGLENPGESICSFLSYSSLCMDPSLTGQGLGLLFPQPQQALAYGFGQPPLSWLCTSSTAQGSSFSSPKSQRTISPLTSRENLSLDSPFNGSGMGSAQDTPTRRSKRNRIAAHFPLP